MTIPRMIKPTAVITFRLASQNSTCYGSQSGSARIAETASQLLFGYISSTTHLSKCACTAKVSSSDDDEEHGDPNGDGHVRSSGPVRDDDGSSGNLGRQGDGEFVKVIPPYGEAKRGVTVGSRRSAGSETRERPPSRSDGKLCREFRLARNAWRSIRNLPKEGRGQPLGVKG